MPQFAKGKKVQIPLHWIGFKGAFMSPYIMATSLLIGFTRRMQCAQVKFSFLFNTRQLVRGAGFYLVQLVSRKQLFGDEEFRFLVSTKQRTLLQGPLN